MNSITRDSHYVPQATLRRWSADGVNVSAYRLLVSHENVPVWEQRPVRALTHQRDLYTTFEGDQEGDEFETFITREIEEPGQEAIERLLAQQKLKPVHWRRVAKFVAAQQLRTPLHFVEFVKRINETIPETLASVVNRIEEKGLAAAATEDEGGTRFDYLSDRIRVVLEHPSEPDQPAVVRAQVSSSRTFWLRSIRHFLTNPVICSHRWRTLVPAGDAEWPVTDHPVLTLNYYGPGKYDFGAGWGRKGSEFILPVSPRLAVATQIGTDQRGARLLTAAETAELQRIIVNRALRWIIARQPMDWVVSARPRIVNREAYDAERSAWNTWHSMHMADEAEFRKTSKPVDDRETAALT
jgi:hypothetical protein